VVPVVTIGRADHAVLLAKALLAGGLTVVEITLRTPAALDAVREQDTDRFFAPLAGGDLRLG